jgi:hypothetical protein
MDETEVAKHHQALYERIESSYININSDISNNIPDSIYEKCDVAGGIFRLGKTNTDTHIITFYDYEEQVFLLCTENPFVVISSFTLGKSLEILIKHLNIT